MSPRSVELGPAPVDRLRALIGPERSERFEEVRALAVPALEGRVVWSVNSTATGGGVAEMLQVLLAYARAFGIDARWLVTDGEPAFFAITKRIHNRLHGATGDGGPLGDAEHAVYERVMKENLTALVGEMRPDDIVLLHDPQTAGLAAGLRDAGMRVVWRCHVGIDEQNDESEQGWAFLRRYLAAAEAHVFSRASYAPPWLEAPVHVIAPSLDPFAAKNDDLDDGRVRALLCEAGVLTGSAKGATFRRRDGSTSVARGGASMLSEGPPPTDAPLVVQVSRWDRLKDMPGVIRAFADHVAPTAAGADAHLVLAGPDVRRVSDDPEGAEVLAECEAVWHALPAPVRARTHLASLWMDDVEHNAVLVNALQRHAAVVVQKSLREGFGLTVAEAMWKRRPVVAGAVGGILDQIDDGVSGVLVDPTDLAATGGAIAGLLADADRRAAMGDEAWARVHERFLPDRHLQQYAALFVPLIER